MIARRLGVVTFLLPSLALVLGPLEFPKLPAFIPIEIARVDPALVPRLDALNKERADLTLKSDDFDRTCGKVVAGSAGDLQCASYFPILSAAVQKHADKSLIFLQAYASGEAAAKVVSPPVLRAAALPRAVEDAIAGAYRDAGPEVIDRVRRGYQSVQANDWKLAAAWFKDALNRAPNNVGLKRLVELAEVPPQASAPKFQLPADSDVQFLFPGEPPSTASTMRTPGPNDVYLYYPTSGYKRMTPEGARCQQLLDTMAGKTPGSIVLIR